MKKILRIIQEVIPSKVFIVLYRVLIFVFLSFLGFLFVSSIQDYALAQRKKLFLVHTKILAASLDVVKFKKLLGEDSLEKKEIYSEFQQQFTRMKHSYENLKYVFLMEKKGQDVISVVENIEENPEMRSSKPGDVYFEASPGFRSLFERGEGLVEGPLTDRWGTFYSALVPLKDPDTNQTLAVFGVDIDLKSWQHELRPVTWLALIAAIVFFGALFILLNLVTYQRDIIHRLTANEERYRQVADNSHDWIWETDPNGFLTYSSRAVRTILGYEIDEVINKKYFYELCSPEDRERLRLEVNRVLDDADLVFQEIVKMKHKNNNEIILEVRGFARLDQDGQIAGWRGMARDVTRLKQQENRMMSLAKFSLENPNQVLRVSFDGTILYANSASKKLLQHWGVKIGEIVPKDWRRTIEESLNMSHPLERQISIEDKVFLFILTPVKESEYINIYGLDITRREKMEQEVKESKRALEIANRDLAENEKTLRLMLKDLELKNKQLEEAQEELIQSQKMAAVGSISSGIAHEIKNPLAIILQGTERIDKILDKTQGEGREFVEMIKNAATRANKVVGTLLNFARATNIELKPVKIENMIETAVTLIAPEATERHIEIQRNYHHGDSFILGDNIALEQVFFDLFVNSMDAMGSQGGKINITTRVSHGKGEGHKPSLVIEVADTGCGIPEENIGMMFVPFFTTKEIGKGTGLGLSIVYLLLQRHHGKIEVKSQMNQGTTFIIHLPIYKDHR